MSEPPQRRGFSTYSTGFHSRRRCLWAVKNEPANCHSHGNGVLSLPTQHCRSSRRTFFAPLLLLGSLLGSRPANAEMLWQGDFETGDLTQWDSTNLVKTGDRDNLIFVTGKVADGMKAAEITLRPDVIFEPYNQSRVEVKHNGLRTKNDQESYYAWSFMVPADAAIRSNIGYWESRVTSLNTMTFWIEPGDGGTVIKFGTGNLGETTRWTAELELNEWHRIAIHNIWSQDPDIGKVDVWYDGTQVVTGATATKRDANELFFQMGLHRSDPADPVQVIYIDAAREATTQAEILTPLPDPMGMGGMGGAGGSGGATSVVTGGAAGSAAGGSAAAGTAGSGGATSAGGAAVVAGTAGMAQAGMPSATPPVTSAPTMSDDGSCSLTAARGSSSGASILLSIVGAALLLACRRR
jgi:hypothetical protein